MRAKILGFAMTLTNAHGFGNVTREMIMRHSTTTTTYIATGTVSYHFKGMRRLEAAIVERAIETENLTVLGQAISAKHPIALKAPDHLKQRAVLALAV